ncbi:hypothetical protein BC941DRAFT_415423 [Chlamydoabsidia padenii]|nr:hypothetical protein BC941DRAFT_415423 [Chlamydoabsidia padenii]
MYNRTREKALDRLHSILRQHNAMSPLASRTEELVDLLAQRIEHGESPRETIMAMKLLGLAFINHSDESSHFDQEVLYQDAAQGLKAKAKESTSKKIKAQCYETLGLLTYLVSSQIDAQIIRQDMYNLLAGNDDDDDDDDNDISEPTKINDDNDDDDDDDDILIATIIRTYALMFVISFCQGPVNRDIIKEEMDKVIGEFELRMDFPGDSQTASGQAVALMFETLQSAAGDKSDTVGKSEQNELNELVHTLRTLSMEQQDEDDNYLFQDVLSTVEDGNQPYHEMEIKGKTFVLDRWSKIIPLNVFHRCLGKSGLDQHYKSNDAIWKLFGKSDDERSDSETSLSDEPSLAATVKYASNVSKFDKSMIYQENKKTRTKRLAAGRSGKDRL